jgi:hypothetical protein
MVWLSGNNFTSAYRDERISEYADITLLVQRISFDFDYNEYLEYTEASNKSSYIPQLEFPLHIRTSSESNWANAFTSENYIAYVENRGKLTLSMELKKQFEERQLYRSSKEEWPNPSMV